MVELKSKHDRLDNLQEKMKSWIKNGAHLAWLIDPESETVYISQTDQEMALHHDFNIPLSADPVLKGYTLDFGRLGLPKS